MVDCQCINTIPHIEHKFCVHQLFFAIWFSPCNSLWPFRDGDLWPVQRLSDLQPRASKRYFKSPASYVYCLTPCWIFERSGFCLLQYYGCIHGFSDIGNQGMKNSKPLLGCPSGIVLQILRGQHFLGISATFKVLIYMINIYIWETTSIRIPNEGLSFHPFIAILTAP